MGNTTSTFEPHLIEKNENGENIGKVVKAGCNTSGTFMITDKGELYTCGSGEIGHGETKRVGNEDMGVFMLPKQIVGNRTYSDIFCNDNSVVVFCPLKIFSISPNCGPSNGNTILSIIGSAFKDFSKLSVRFIFGGIQHDVKATFDKVTTTIFVRTPVFTSLVSNLELPCYCKIQITFDGYYFTEYADPFFIYNNQTKITGIVPKCGPTGGGSSLQININLDNIPSKMLFTLTIGFQAKSFKEETSVFGKKRKKTKLLGDNLDESRSVANFDERSNMGNNEISNKNKEKINDSQSVNPLDINPIDVTVERANWYCSYGTYENEVINCQIPKIENFVQSQVEYNVDISINGQQFSGYPMIYRFYEIKFERIDPNISTVEGGLIMKLYGSGLFDSLTKKAKITSKPNLGERYVDLQWDRVDKALILVSQPLVWITNSEDIIKNISPSELYENFVFEVEITMNNSDWIPFGSYKYYDPKIIRITHVTFPDNCITLQDRFLNLKNQDPISEEEKVAIGIVPPPSDVKLYDTWKKVFADEDNAINTVPKRAYNAINLYSKYFPHNTVLKVRFRNNLCEYEFPAFYKNRHRISCLFSESDGVISPEESIKLDLEEGKKGKKPSGKKK